MANKKKVTTTVTTTVTEEIVNNPVNEKTQIVCILDRSGSMSSIMTDSIGGFNTFLKQQKELKDEATLTVALFDDKYELLYDNVDIKKAEELTSKIWYPRGTTALYDAIGKTINAVKSTHLRLGNEKPAKVLVCIVTDGLENASKEYKLENIKSLIKQCENDDWNFIYLAANQNAFAVGDSFGVSRGNTLNFVASGAGVGTMYDAFYTTTSLYRGMSTSSADFKSRSKSLIDDKSNTTNIDPNFLVKDNNGNTTIAGDFNLLNGNPPYPNVGSVFSASGSTINYNVGNSSNVSGGHAHTTNNTAMNDLKTLLNEPLKVKFDNTVTENKDIVVNK
jgi:uncharacterized protein YegL